MPRAKSKTTKKAKTATKKKAFRQDAATGKIVSKERVETDKAGTVTQTVNQDNDGVRSDKGTKRVTKANTAQEKTSETPPTQPLTAVAGDALPEVPESAYPADASPLAESGATAKAESEDALPCLTTRPTRPKGYTCIDEINEAVENPEHFTEPQLAEIISENNLCANCRTRYDDSTGAG